MLLSAVLYIKTLLQSLTFRHFRLVTHRRVIQMMWHRSVKSATHEPTLLTADNVGSRDTRVINVGRRCRASELSTDSVRGQCPSSVLASCIAGLTEYHYQWPTQDFVLGI